MRSRWLALDLAISHLVAVKERLLLTLWHLADRWGRVTRDGVKIRVGGLTQQLLGDIVGAHRPSVSVALGELNHEGTVRQLGGGGFLLLKDPPDPSKL